MRVTLAGLAEAVLLVVGGGVAGVTLTLPFAGWSWVLDLFTHFPVHLLAASVVCAAFAAMLANWRMLAVLLATSALHGTRIATDVLREGSRGDGTSELRLLLANVHTSNRDHDRFVDQARQLDPDVIVTLEVDETWCADLRGGLPEWSERAEIPQSDNFGLAVWSKAPMEWSRLDLGPVPAIVAEIGIRADGRERVSLVAVHTLPPVRAPYAAFRDAQLAMLVGARRDLGERVIVAGDLNASPWSSPFRPFLDATGLRDSRAGFGLQGTWRAEWPSWFRSPIDHVLVDGFDVVDRRVLDEVGSDHRGVLVELSLR